MQFLRQEITFDRFVRGILYLSVAGIILFTLRYLSPVLIPFLVAWVGAWILIPVVRFFQFRCRLRSRALSVVVTLILVTAATLGVLRFFVPMMIDSITHIKDATLLYLQSGSHALHLPDWMDHYVAELLSALKVEEVLRENNLLNVVRNSLPQMWDMVLSTANILLSFVASTIAVLYLIFLLIDYERTSTGWIDFVPVAHRPFLSRLASDVASGMRGYFRGQALIALSNCVMFSIGFWLIDLPMPIGMGCFVGLISFIPYVQVLGFLPAALLALLQMAETGRSFWLIMLLVLIVYVVVQVIQDVFVTPKIMGKIMGLSPAVILLSLSVWGFLLGIVGLIIALPTTTILVAYYKQYVLRESPPSSPLFD